MWAWIKSLLGSNTPDSSLRFNLLLVTIPIAIILASVAFFIFYRTVVPIEVTFVSKTTLKYVYADIPWAAIGAFVALLITSYFTLVYGKKINKDAENQTPKPGDPAQPNINV
jgi:hypothetical protein